MLRSKAYFKGKEGKERNRRPQAVQELLQQMTEVHKEMNLERWDKTTQLVKMGEANLKGWHRNVL